MSEENAFPQYPYRFPNYQAPETHKGFKVFVIFALVAIVALLGAMLWTLVSIQSELERVREDQISIVDELNGERRTNWSPPRHEENQRNPAYTERPKRATSNPSPNATRKVHPPQPTKMPPHYPSNPSEEPGTPYPQKTAGW